MKLTHALDYSLLCPLPVSSNAAISQASGLDRGAPGTEVFALRCGGGQLGVHLRADVAPGEIDAVFVELLDSVEDSVTSPCIVLTHIAVLESGIFHRGPPGPKIA